MVEGEEDFELKWGGFDEYVEKSKDEILNIPMSEYSSVTLYSFPESFNSFVYKIAYTKGVKSSKVGDLFISYGLDGYFRYMKYSKLSKKIKLLHKIEKFIPVSRPKDSIVCDLNPVLGNMPVVKKSFRVRQDTLDTLTGLRRDLFSEADNCAFVSFVIAAMESKTILKSFKWFEGVTPQTTKLLLNSLESKNKYYMSLFNYSSLPVNNIYNNPRHVLKLNNDDMQDLQSILKQFRMLGVLKDEITDYNVDDFHE